MVNTQNNPLLQLETTCGSLLYELQIIWDEVGESGADRDKMLFELEQECLEVYRRKVDKANRSRAQLRQEIADSEAELAAICSTMGERPVHIRQSDQTAGSLKEELSKILPQVEEMKRRKSERSNQFHEVLEQIQKISHEIHGSRDCVDADETDLSLRKLEELQTKLYLLQKEKSDRQKQVQDHLIALNSICSVLGLNFRHTVREFHPSLGEEGSKDISKQTIDQLAAAVQKLREVKLQRMQRLQDLATTLLELWNLMDTPIEEQQAFRKVTCNVAASEHEITEPNSLSVDFLSHVEAEVSRLEEFKASKMKELVLKKRSELEEICRKTHMVPEADSAIDIVIEAIDSGAVDPGDVLEQIEIHIANVKEEAFSRKEILEKVEKWLVACDEECWLEEYNRDEKRYNAGRGAHLILKRAEKARALVNKLPTMVDSLAVKVITWEQERGIEFTYDGVRLLSMLEDYTVLREEKEQERRRLRDQKKLQGQLMAEQEARYGSKPSPAKQPQSAKKTPRMSGAGSASSKRLSLGGSTLQTPKPDPIKVTTPSSRPAKRSDQTNHHHDDGTGVARKPFSPIHSTPSAKANVINLTDDLNTGRGETLKKIAVANNNTPLKKVISNEDEENVPATPAHHQQHLPNPAEEDVNEETEYSFEERRAGFVVPRTPSSQFKSGIQV